MGSFHGHDDKASASRGAADWEFFSVHGYLRVPRLVQWMPTVRCSLSCPHCLCGEGRTADELSLEESGRLLDQVAGLGVSELLLTGGEPLERADLPEIIDMMRARSIRWSLNTAVFPGERCRAAMEKHPPAFVAVSLDGPEELHDAFRGRKGSFAEALRSIGYFSRLTGRNVAAGTTVGRMNFGALPETFRIVLSSGASSWGIHLIFPEGRAARRRDLFLSRAQLRKLVGFIASRRQSFPLVLADEIGYCGDREPELRRGPFACGAGRAQCVVLSDGEVVPCTTLDRRTSAGNVRERALEAIWRDGFAALRGQGPGGKCRSCEFLSLCRGGCWLQRRGGRHCHRDVWCRAGSYAAAAGIALCLGLAAGSSPADATVKPAIGAVAKEKSAASSQALEDAVIDWCLKETSWLPHPDSSKVESGSEKAQAKLAKDPAGKYLAQIRKGKYPAALGARAKRIKTALGTAYRSLAYASLLWRDLMLWCFEGNPPEKRTAQEKKLLAETMELLAEKTGAWRAEIFEKQLDAFISTGPEARFGWFMMSKAIMPGETFRAAKGKLSMEHWEMKDVKDKVTKEHIALHPFGEHMRLEFKTSSGSGLKIVSGKKTREVAESDAMGVFDTLLIPEKKGTGQASVSFSSGGKKFDVTLPPGTEVLYADLLLLAYNQNKAAMDGVVSGLLPSGELPDPRPLYLPALQGLLKTQKVDETQTAQEAKQAALDIWIF